MRIRRLEPLVREALADTPVVFLKGARQTGKTTLARRVADSIPGARYLSLDDHAVQEAALHDPQGLVGGWPGLTVLDEVQRAPALFQAIKRAVDADRRPGSFLLTGSADVRLAPKLSESLAGRVEPIVLWPFSVGEALGVEERFVDALFAPEFPALAADPAPRPLAERVLTGGFPEVLTRARAERREAWFRSYVATVLDREVRDLARIEGLSELPRMLEILAARTAGLLNVSEVGRSLGMPQKTAERYLTLLQASFLLAPLPSWHANLGKRLVKAPKVHLCDSGLAAALARFGAEDWRAGAPLRGALLESFVAGELRKQCAFARARPSLWHFRTGTGEEADFLLEGPGRRIVGLEVKGSATLGAEDFRGLQALEELTGGRFLRGVVLYGGEEVLRIGRRTLALPVSALWRVREVPG